MLTRTQEIIEYITDYIQQKNEDHSVWYIGICQEAHDIIFEALKRSSQYWMYIETGSPQIADKVMSHFIGTKKAKKDTRNTNHTATASVIYVYRKHLASLSKTSPHDVL